MLIGAIDCGGTKVLAAVVDEKGNVFSPRKASVPTQDKAHYFMQGVNLLRASCAEKGVALTSLSGVGLTIPGMTDGKDRVFGSPSAGWGEFRVRPLLYSALGTDKLKVCFENDINACALAERKFANGGDDFLWLTISTGNGGATVCDGRLLHGTHSCAGEFGHVKVEFEHPYPCGCGGKGCLEAHASGVAIGRMAKEAGVGNDAAECAKLAYEGNQKARHVYRTAGNYIGKALASICCVTNPKTIYIGGGVSRSLDLLLPGIHETFDTLALRQCADVEIRQTRLGYNAALLGAASLCLP